MSENSLQIPPEIEMDLQAAEEMAKSGNPDFRMKIFDASKKAVEKSFALAESLLDRIDEIKNIAREAIAANA